MKIRGRRGLGIGLVYLGVKKYSQYIGQILAKISKTSQNCLAYIKIP